MKSCMVLRIIERDEYEGEPFRPSVTDDIVNVLREDDPLHLGLDEWYYGTEKQCGEFIDGKENPEEILTAVNGWNNRAIATFAKFLKSARTYSGTEEEFISHCLNDKRKPDEVSIYDLRAALQCLCGRVDYDTNTIYIDKYGSCYSSISEKEKAEILEHPENCVLCEIWYN